MFLTTLLTCYWLFIQKKTFVIFRFRGFRFDGHILYDIGRVGLPASVAQMSMSLMAFLLTTIIATVGGTIGVAVYTSGWRIVSIATLPMLGVALINFSRGGFSTAGMRGCITPKSMGARAEP